MKKIYTFCAAAALLLSCQPLMADELPEGIRSVSPEQGYINTFINVYPQGARNIQIVFAGSNVTVDKESKSTVAIYVDGSETPAEVLTTAESGIYVDGMTGASAGILFNGVYNTPGSTYKVVAGEGVWLYGVDQTPSPAFTLDYAIRKFYTYAPLNGSVLDEFSSIVFTLPEGATDVAVNGNYVNVMDPSGELAACTLTADGETVTLALDEAAKAVGTYIVTCDAGWMSYKRGEETVKVDAVQYSYSIKAPASDDDCTFTPADGATISALYEIAVNAPLNHPDGFCDMGVRPTLHREGVQIGQFRFDSDNVYRLCDGMAVDFAEQPLTEPGVYTVKFPQGFYNVFGEEFWSAPATTLTYTISATGAIDSVENASEAFTVYSVSGVCMGRNLSADAFRSLPSGFYIVNGRKVAK